MRAHILLATLLTIGMAAGYACGSGQTDKGAAPDDMHEVTYRGFTFLCPDVMEPMASLSGDEQQDATLSFSFHDMGALNSISFTVEDAEQTFTPEVGKQLAEEEMALESQGAEVECQVMKDGLMVKTVYQGTGETETGYITKRILFNGKKRCTLIFTYTEWNAPKLAQYVDAVMNSVSVAKNKRAGA